jgi:hypothetical protein
MFFCLDFLLFLFIVLSPCNSVLHLLGEAPFIFIHATIIYYINISCKKDVRTSWRIAQVR